MSLSKHRAVYELCLRRGVMILEDNPYGELRFSGNDVPVIKSLDTEGIVIYCGSFSKILSPGIRLGFVSAPKAVVQKLVVAKQVSDVHTNIFFQMLADEYLARFDLGGPHSAHTGHVQEKFLAMHGTAARCSRKPRGFKADGGIFLWCTLPEGRISWSFAPLRPEGGHRAGHELYGRRKHALQRFPLKFLHPDPRADRKQHGDIGRRTAGFPGLTSYAKDRKESL